MVEFKGEQKVKNKCDWNTKTQSCSFADKDDFLNEVGGRRKCQFYLQGKCKQFEWKVEEEEQLHQLLEDYHKDHQESFEAWQNTLKQ